MSASDGDAIPSSSSSSPAGGAPGEVKSPDDIISEKSAKIKAWVQQRLEHLESQNQRLREQNRRCTKQLKTLTSCAERNKHWRKSLLSQSVTGALPIARADMLDPNRTSDDSGLTSDETSGELRQPPTTLPLASTILNGSPTNSPRHYPHHHYNREEASSGTSDSSAPQIDLMTQSTSALLKKSPRQQRRMNVFPKTNANVSRNGNGGSPRTQVEKAPTEQENHSPSTTDSSPWEEKPKAPIPAPRKTRQHGDQAFGSPVVLRTRMERDSLNSYAGEDDYGEYEEDDEMFDEIDSPTRPVGNASRANYVNLNDFCIVKDSHVYSDIVKAAPELPKHAPLLNYEQKLFRTAEKCLSVVEDGPSTSGEGGYLQPSTPSKTSFGRNSNSSRRHLSSAYSLPSRDSHPDSGLGRISDDRNGNGVHWQDASPPPDGMVLVHPPTTAAASPAPRISSAASDYAIPPDASKLGSMRRSTPRRDNELPPIIRASVIPHSETELAGYLTTMSDNRLRSLKRRYVLLKNSELKFFRTQKHMLRDEPPSTIIKLRDVKTVTKITSKGGCHGFEIALETDSYRYHAENDKATDDWISTLSQQLKNLTIAELAQRSRPLEPEISGWVTKVKHGHQKRFFAQLIADKIFFFKNPDEKIPHSHQVLRGARVCEKSKGSSDEYSASSGDEQAELGDVRGSTNGSSSASAIYGNAGDADYSVCVEAVASDPWYLILRSSEDKDKWLYYLRMAARDASITGTPFEVLLERLMAAGSLESQLWQDVLLTTVEEHQTEPLTMITNPELRKKALEIDMACFLFTSVQMRPIAVQYHVDLAQNVLSAALEHEVLQNEVYAQLVRLTSGQQEFAYQAWKLLAMAIPLYLPKQYSLLWLVKNHVERKRKNLATPEGRMAEYCHQALSNRQKVGDRREGPSKLEAISILTRDPNATALPYSIAIKLPTGDHQVIEFDGSTEIGQCLSSLCLKLGLRPALLSGYALYANDPMGGANDLILLKGRQKLCDCLTLWERQMKDARSGRVTTDACAVKLQLRLRNYWPSLAEEETATERLFLCHRLAEEVVAGHLPLSNELAEELCALYAQMCYGDIQTTTEDSLLDEILSRFYPNRLLEVVNNRSLKSNVSQHWRSQLKGVSVAECVRLILVVLRKWKFFGAFVKEARMKINDRRIFVALTEGGVHLLSDQLDLIRSFPFHRLISFGEYHGDFMLTVTRSLSPNSHPEETPRERLTFTMERKAIEQLSTHLAEYIRCQKLLWKMSTHK